MENLLPIVTAIGAFGGQVDQIGKATGASRVSALLGIFPILLPLAKIDFKAAKDELKDLSAEDKAKLQEALSTSFDLSDDQLESVIENGITVISSAYALVLSGIDLVGDIKALKAGHQTQEQEALPTVE